MPMYVPVKPDWMSEEAVDTLSRGYLLPEETPRDLFSRVATTVEKYIPEPGLAGDIFDCLWRGYIGLASPVASNLGTSRGLPVSCYSLTIDDSINSIYSHLKEASQLSKNGGGVGCDFHKIRPAGSPISTGGTSSGVVPWARQYDLSAAVVSQGATRRGSYALYLPIDHPDLEELLRCKDHAQGDPRSFIDSNIAVTVTNEWLTDLVNGDEKKKEIFSRVLELRMISGSPYIIFIDNVNDANPDCYKERNLKVTTSNLCSEITLYTDENHTFVCVLSSLNLLRYTEWKDYKGPNTSKTVPELLIYLLDAVCEEFIIKASRLNSMGRAVRFAKKSRALGAGTMGLAALYQKLGLPFKSPEARQLNIEIHKFIQEKSLKASRDLARTYGEPEWCVGSGMRNSHLTATAPTRTNSVICGAISQGIEPIESNYYIAKQAKGSFVRKNPFLEEVLEKYGKNTEEIWESMLATRGSVQHLDFLSDHEKQVFLTAREIDQFELLRQASERQPYICQAQSLNLFVNNDTSAEDIWLLHLAAWRYKLKSLYYLRSNSVLASSTESADSYSNVIITKPGCPYCDKAKQYLYTRGHTFKEISKQKAESLGLYRESWGTFPQIYISKSFIGGYDQLMEYFDESERSTECVACEG